MEPEVIMGDIVRSLRGRDAGLFFIVLAAEDEMLFLSDGRMRRAEKPKTKKRKHVEFAARTDNRVTQKLETGQRVTNNDLRRVLAEFGEEEGNG